VCLGISIKIYDKKRIPQKVCLGILITNIHDKKNTPEGLPGTIKIKRLIQKDCLGLLITNIYGKKKNILNF